MTDGVKTWGKEDAFGVSLWFGKLEFAVDTCRETLWYRVEERRNVAWNGKVLGWLERNSRWNESGNGVGAGSVVCEGRVPCSRLFLSPLLMVGEREAGLVACVEFCAG